VTGVTLLVVSIPGVRLPRRLSTQITVFVLGLILMTVGIGAVVSFVQARSELDANAGERALALARVVATDADVVEAFSTPEPPAIIDPIAEHFREASGAAFIVVADAKGIRFSHPNPQMIGTSLLDDPGENPQAVLAGKTFVGVQNGSLGPSMRAKTPIRDANGKVIGLVSVGISEQRISQTLRAHLLIYLLPAILGLGLGVVGAVLLSRRVKRQTFGLEPGEIARLLEQREAMLHGVREGAVTVDTAGRITMINDEAQRLLGVDRETVGSRLSELLPVGRVREVLTGQTEGLDEVIVLRDRVLVVNRMPVALRGRAIGAVITLRDRTELDTLARELQDVRGLADALRAQEHEFGNRLHVIGGLVELGKYEQALSYINTQSDLHQELASSIVASIGDPVVSALLLGKAAVASERGVQLSVSCLTDLPEFLDEDSQGLVTILGNLIDNAIDSSSQAVNGGRVQVTVGVEDESLVIRVHDSGNGVDPAIADEIFTDGFTTKAARQPGYRRGLGLALVSQEVRRRRGRIAVENADGAVFTVTLPVPSGARVLEAPVP
jgi:two-component system, CitB family, sensor kinase